MSQKTLHLLEFLLQLPYLRAYLWHPNTVLIENCAWLRTNFRPKKCRRNSTLLWVFGQNILKYGISPNGGQFFFCNTSISEAFYLYQDMRRIFFRQSKCIFCREQVPFIKMGRFVFSKKNYHKKVLIRMVSSSKNFNFLHLAASCWGGYFSCAAFETLWFFVRVYSKPGATLMFFIFRRERDISQHCFWNAYIAQRFVKPAIFFDIKLRMIMDYDLVDKFWKEIVGNMGFL